MESVYFSLVRLSISSWGVKKGVAYLKGFHFFPIYKIELRNEEVEVLEASVQVGFLSKTDNLVEMGIVDVSIDPE